MCDVEEEVWAISGLAGDDVESLSEAMGQDVLFQARSTHWCVDIQKVLDLTC
jgi:hypothetical protein